MGIDSLRSLLGSLQVQSSQSTQAVVCSAQRPTAVSSSCGRLARSEPREQLGKLNATTVEIEPPYPFANGIEQRTQFGVDRALHQLLDLNAGT
jgi:hypothetical protein